MYKFEIALILKIKEKWYQFYIEHRTKCSCFVCRTKMRLIHFANRPVEFYIWLRSVKWIKVEYWGSDYSDFREYEVIGRGKIRVSDSKGLKWPKTNYNHIKVTDMTEAA